MKVLVVNNMAPFIWGGAEELAVNLQRNIEIAGHESEILRIPFQWEPAESISSQMMMARAFELFNVDHVIALKFPAYLIRHPSKTLWLLHQYRQAYDLLDAGQTNLPCGSTGDQLRSLIRNADNETFAESKHIYTNSKVTRDRLKHYNGFDADVLLPPINDPESFEGGEGEGYIFAGGRVNGMKRQHLLLEALRLADSKVRLVIAGPPDSEADADKLRQLVERYSLQNRVTLDLGFLPRSKYVSYVNKASAVAYLPFDEDSLGYVTMEAAMAGKPLISCSDCGGILGLAKHQETGWVVDPEVGLLAEVMSHVVTNPKKAREFGAVARELWLSYGVNWENTVEALLK